MFDNAYHFLSLKDLTSNYRTVEKPPRFDKDFNQADVTNGETILPSIVANGHSRAMSGPRGSTAETNDIPMTKPTETAPMLDPPTTLQGL